MHQTIKRPPTEPYEFWAERRRIQKKELKQYLRGKPVWRSMYLEPIYNAFGMIVGTKRVKLQGTYVMPICPLCDEKDKYCECLKIIND